MTVVVLDRSDLEGVPTERLEAEALTLAGHLAAAMCRFLDVVAELARREAFLSWEVPSMAHWVAWKCGIGPRAAQDHVRVAVALTHLPVTHDEFARGQLSYSKVRALTRFITPGNETDTVILARHTTASQLDRIARAHVAACRAADPDQNRAALDASSVTMRTNTDGTVTLTARVPADIGIRAMKAIDHTASELPADRHTEPNSKRVIGFETVIDAYLEPDPSRPAVEIVGHVDIETLSKNIPGRCELDGHRIASETARRLACDCGMRLALDQAETLLDLGRRARFPNPALRRAVETRDERRCRFPGCTQRNRLRAHHAQHWAHGGPTDRANLLMLCPTHHRAVHEGGWNVRADGHGGFTFHDPGGHHIPEVALPPSPCNPGDVIGANERAGITITPESIRSLSEGEPMDLDWTMMTVFCAHPPQPRPPTPNESSHRRSAERPTRGRRDEG